MAVTGFVSVKNGKYYAVLTLRDENGKRRQKWFPTDLPQRGNKRNAEKILKDLLDEWNENDVPYSQMTFAEYLCQWVEGASADIKPNTYRNYRAMIKNHVVPYFEQHKILLQELRPYHLEE